MKKACRILLILTVMLFCLYPLALLLCSLSEVHLELTHPVVLTAAAALTSGGAALIAAKSGENAEIPAFPAALSLPLALIFAFCLLFTRSCQVWDLLLLTLAVAACLYLTFKSSGRKWWKTVCLIAASLLTALFLYIAPMALLFGSIGKVTVVQSVESPSGSYYAELIDDDQGALGGSTLVYLYRGRPFDGGFFSLYRREEVYGGQWGEFNSLTLSWDGDARLMVGSRACDNPFVEAP